MDVISDAELMRRVHDKQRFALEELYDRYVKLVYSFAMKATRDEQKSREIVQLVFMRLWTSSLSFDPAKGKFVNWLITITRNITIDYLRIQNRKNHLVDITDFRAVEAAELTEETVIEQLQRQRIRQACQELNEKQAQLIERIYWQGFTLSEIAEQNNEPLGTVKSRLHLALKILRNHLGLAQGGVRDVEL
ncbi:sigma-70 family RNA polymerase sigma factor [Paenibacillus sediminis]|uniref:RNA polymerase sigma-70 factor (ECF subfamily) n=1 Tax=Paenibacillus sediminis TaxID=664909 RepID=A0ABS4H0L5_9BACL|nr:sigma-70 family RNA polymerase sigma factor [Paenibacillus sediminis]MBP1936078.1 RNA polymerase sigma-70 factor (ECF subfamily) [Paenibacillus sediminis]